MGDCVVGTGPDVIPVLPGDVFPLPQAFAVELNQGVVDPIVFVVEVFVCRVARDTPVAVLPA